MGVIVGEEGQGGQSSNVQCPRPKENSTAKNMTAGVADISGSRQETTDA